nr:proteoglycan 4-like [Misgurnus anguillicaudatus]
MTVSYASHISASVTKEKRAFFCPSAPAPCGVGIFTKEMKVGSETVTGAGRQCPDKLMRAYSHLENGSTIFLYRKDRPLVSIRPDVPAPPQPTEPSNSVSSSVESDACPSEPAVATSAVAPQVEEALIGRAVQTSEETSSLKPPSAPPNTAFPAKNDLWYTVPQLQLGEERDVEVRPKWARLAGCGSENQFPTVFASPSDLDQEDFPMENLPSPAPVSAPVPEEPQVAALPSPAPVSAPVPEEPRVAALPSPAPVSAPVPEEPRVAALPSPAPVSAPVPEEPRVAALPSPAPVSAPVPEEPRVAALPSPASVSAPVPEETRVAALSSPAPVSAPVPEEPRVAALPSPAPVSAPVPEEPRVAALPSPASVSAPVPEETRVAALSSPAPVSAPVPEEPRVAALPLPAPVSASVPEEPRVATSEETSSLKPPSAPTNAFPTKNDLWYTVPQLQLGEERDVEVRPKWARLAGCGIPEEPRVATSEETSSLKPPSAPPNAAFPTKNDLWYTVPQLQLGEERDVEVRPKWARLAGCGIPEEPRVATSEETSSLKPPSAPPNAAFPTKNDLWYTVPLCTTDKEDVDSDLYHHKREDIMETETSLSERAETLVFDLVRLSGSGSVSAEFQFKVGLTLVRFAETSRLACRLARETMDRWIFQLQREGRWGRKLKDLSRFIVRFPTVFASPSDLDQEDFPMEDLSLDEENEDHPLPVPVVAPVPEEPRVAALPSPMSAQVQVNLY